MARYIIVGFGKHKKRSKISSKEEKDYKGSGRFPRCRGAYPECPTAASVDEGECKLCPKYLDYKR